MLTIYIDGKAHEVPAWAQGLVQNWRIDAAETLAFSRMLETVESRVYQKKYPELKGRQFVAVKNQGGNASEILTYYVWDAYVTAVLVANKATTIPMVTASAQKFSIPYGNLADGYEFSLQDMRNAAKAGVDLDGALALAARRGIELGIDQALARGVPELRTTGLINNPNVPVAVLPTGSWTDSTTAEQMLADLAYLPQLIVTSTKQIWIPDTLLLPSTMFARAASKVVGADLSTTVLKAFLANNPYIKNVDQWTELDTANPSGGKRVMCYKRDDEAMCGEVGQEYEQLPPQVVGFNTSVLCQARVAGVVFRHPLAAAYADNG